jgi:hypothetical protein
MGKGMMIRENIGRKATWYERNGMIMDSMGRERLFESGKNSLVVGDDRLEVRMHRGCLNNMSEVELGNNSTMTLFKDLFHVMGTDDLRGYFFDALELIIFSLLLELHG